jgi:hypothetical protein
MCNNTGQLHFFLVDVNGYVTRPSRNDGRDEYALSV